MKKTNFSCQIDIRYGDLDPQGHVNNAKYLTYFEHARTQYLRELGLFKKGSSFLDIGVILADIHIAFLKPIHWEDKITLGVRTTNLGNKSIKVTQLIQDENSEIIYAEGEVVMVTYDYHRGTTIPIPTEWRKIIIEFEGLIL